MPTIQGGNTAIRTQSSVTVIKTGLNNTDIHISNADTVVSAARTGLLTLLNIGRTGPQGASGNQQEEFPQTKTLIYASGKLSSIEYSNGNVKNIFYINDKVDYVDFNKGNQTIRTRFIYQGNSIVSVEKTAL